MKVTGERFIPGKMFKHSEIEHMHRYTILKRILQDKVVLDAACGTGYGSNIIASVAKKVYGLDISQDAINYANTNYGMRQNLEYIQGDITKLPFDDGMMDVVVSYETIEHVDGDMQRKFLREIKRVLKPDGILIMSTPNKEIYTVQSGNQATEWHVKEFYEEEYDEFLKEEFSNIRYYQQYISKASYLLDGREDEALISNCDLEKKGKFIIAIASNNNCFEKINLNSIYYYPDEYAMMDEICQIYYMNSEEGFSEKCSEIIEIASTNGLVKFEYEFEEKQPIVKMRIDPLQNSCRIKEFKIEVTDINNEKIRPVQIVNNADKELESVHVFYHRDPQYVLSFEKEVIVKKVKIEFVLDEYNLDTYFLHEEIKALNEKLIEEKQKLIEEKQKLIEEKEEFFNKPLISKVLSVIFNKISE